MEGAKQALICPSPAPGPGGWDRELPSSGCVPADPWRQREQAVEQGVGAWAKLRCGSHQICLDEYWGGRLRALCGESATDSRLLTRRGNILTCPCLSLQFAQTSVTRRWLNNAPLQIRSAETESNMRAKLKGVNFRVAEVLQSSDKYFDWRIAHYPAPPLPPDMRVTSWFCLLTFRRFVRQGVSRMSPPF